jgi:hypothetical protein
MDRFKYYDLYNSDRFLKSTEDIDYALHQLLLNNITHFISYKYTNERIESIECGLFKIQDNKVVKIIDNNFISIYSPYDDFVFNNPNLSRLYLKFYNTNIKHNNTRSLVKVPVVPTVNVPDVNKTEIQADLSIEEINQIKNKINQLNKLKEDIKQIKIIQEEEFLNKDCEERYNLRQKKKEEEREQNNYNVFVADIEVYNKLINEENFTEDYIPPFFVGKFYILKYLYDNEYFVEDNIKKPSKDIFKIYTELYDFITNEFKLKEDDIEELFELKNDFKLSLPDRKITTDKQIFDTLNKKNNDVELFVEPTGYSDNDSDSDSDSDSDLESIPNESNEDFNSFDDEIDKLIINKIKDNIMIYKDISKNNKVIQDNFKKDYKIIEYMYNEGFFDNTDIDDSINDYYHLYCILLDYMNDKKIDDEILVIFNDELENFKKYIN